MGVGRLITDVDDCEHLHGLGECRSGPPGGRLPSQLGANALPAGCAPPNARRSPATIKHPPMSAVDVAADRDGGTRSAASGQRPIAHQAVVYEQSISSPSARRCCESWRPLGGQAIDSDSSFIFAYVVIIPIILICRKYYGTAAEHRHHLPRDGRRGLRDRARLRPRSLIPDQRSAQVIEALFSWNHTPPGSRPPSSRSAPSWRSGSSAPAASRCLRGWLALLDSRNSTTITFTMSSPTTNTPTRQDRTETITRGTGTTIRLRPASPLTDAPAQRLSERPFLRTDGCWRSGSCG